MKNKKLFKSLGALMMAAAICVSASLPVCAAESATWETSHVNISGAPYEASHIDQKTISHRKEGAKVVCNYNSHTNANASQGTTTVRCITFSMAAATINNTDTIFCHPDVGAPNVDISVKYTFTANTPTNNDEFWAKGNISKIATN